MATITDTLDPATGQRVEPGTGAARVTLTPRGTGFGVAATTGTIAAALAANSTIFALRLDPGATKRAFIERVRIEWTCLAAFTTPLTAGRRLGLYRGSGAAPTGGTALTPIAKHGSAATSEISIANGGDARISTTGTLTVTGITWETAAFRELSLAHVGAAGAFRDIGWEFASGAESQPIQLDPGQLIGIRNPVVMDAAGTWQATVCVDWHEAPAMDSTA